jgi:NAD(P)-dependent dehydrogenase (short-subunit alcohol dehydrogenase family)
MRELEHHARVGERVVREQRTRARVRVVCLAELARLVPRIAERGLRCGELDRGQVLQLAARIERARVESGGLDVRVHGLGVLRGGSRVPPRMPVVAGFEVVQREHAARLLGVVHLLLEAPRDRLVQLTPQLVRQSFVRRVAQQ